MNAQNKLTSPNFRSAPATLDSNEFLLIRNALAQLPANNAARHTASAALVRVAQAIDDTTEANQRKTKILGLVQEALAQLRLDLKYLAFDLEATRKERDEYKFRLDGLDK